MTNNKVTTENLIIIKGGSYFEIKKALGQWIKLYSKELQNDLAFQLFKKGDREHLILADKRLNNLNFFYLVNYLNYPEGIDYKIDIEAFTVGKDNNQLKDKKILVFIPQTDTKFDNVLVTTNENENYKVDFSGKITQTEIIKSFSEPIDLILENPETLKVNIKVIVKKNKNLNENIISKRFKILSVITVSMTVIGIIINRFDHQLFREFSFLLGMGIGLWFFTDYKMLQINRFYNYSFGIAIGYLFFVLSINLEFYKSILYFGVLHPLTLLLLQKPTRLIYKATLNREPVIERPPPTFWDGIYTIILLISLAIIPFIIIDYLTN